MLSLAQSLASRPEGAAGCPRRRVCQRCAGRGARCGSPGGGSWRLLVEDSGDLSTRCCGKQCPRLRAPAAAAVACGHVKSVRRAQYVAAGGMQKPESPCRRHFATAVISRASCDGGLAIAGPSHRRAARLSALHPRVQCSSRLGCPSRPSCVWRRDGDDGVEMWC
jgi:hypothetical protein